MSIKRIVAVTIAAFGLSVSGYAASANPVNAPAALSSKSTFTLIKKGWGKKFHGGKPFYGKKFHGGGMRYRGHHRRGHWRGGRWIWFGAPIIGLGLYGENCYANCREAGYSPAYCRANAGDFC